MIETGTRVELHPATDAWMRGDRYGTVEKVTAMRYHVRMDRSGHLLKVSKSEQLITEVIV